RPRLAIQERRSARVGRFGRSHDGAVFVDPHAARYVDDAEELVQDVSLVDQRWVARLRALDPRAGRVRAASIESDGDELETQRMELLAHRLPHGQVMPTASPGGPGQQQHFLAAQRPDLEWPTIQVRQ